MSDSKKIDDGGHAYPVCFEGGQNNGDSPYFHTGMSLRDWFAGQVLPNVLNQVMALDSAEYGSIAVRLGAANSRSLIGLMAYEYADAMIAARKAGG